MKRILCTTALTASFVASAALAGDDMDKSFGTMSAEKTDFFALDLIGMRIYNSETEYEPDQRVADGDETEWDDIGEINDIVLSKSGDVRGVILGVGGFQGLGEHDVTVSMDEIKVLYEDGDSDDWFPVANATQEELENAPAYERDNWFETTAAADVDYSDTEELETETADAQMKPKSYDEAETADADEPMTDTDSAAATDADADEKLQEDAEVEAETELDTTELDEERVNQHG